MNVVSPSLAPATGRHSSGAGSVSMRWAALGEAGKVVALLAGVSSETPSRELRDFPVLLRDCSADRREIAESAISDLSAIMEPGLAALMAINARGGDCGVAARALPEELIEARTAIIALLPPSGAMGPRRSA